MTLETLRHLFLAFPGVEETKSSGGSPWFQVRRKFLARLRDNAEVLVLRIPFEERDALMGLFPHVFYTTDHYRDYPSVLVRLATVQAEMLPELIDQAWRFVAPPRLVAQYDAKP